MKKQMSVRIEIQESDTTGVEFQELVLELDRLNLARRINLRQKFSFQRQQIGRASCRERV